MFFVYLDIFSCCREQIAARDPVVGSFWFKLGARWSVDQHALCLALFTLVESSACEGCQPTIQGLAIDS